MGIEGGTGQRRPTERRAGTHPHPGPLELVDLVRGTLHRSRERRVLGHCVVCGGCGAIVGALAALRRARGLGVGTTAERLGGVASVH